MKEITLKTKLKYNHREGNLIQVLLLRIIYEKQSYGYEIIKNIEKITITKNKIKTGTAYTLFRRMEKKGLVKSVWKENDKKPNKRVYTITNEGKEHLKIWLEFIIQRKKIINKLVNFYYKNLKNEKF